MLSNLLILEHLQQSCKKSFFDNQIGRGQMLIRADFI